MIGRLRPRKPPSVDITRHIALAPAGAGRRLKARAAGGDLRLGEGSTGLTELDVPQVDLKPRRLVPQPNVPFVTRA